MNLGLLGRVKNLKIIYFSSSTEMMSLYSPSASTRAPPQSIVDAKSCDRILFTQKTFGEHFIAYHAINWWVKILTNQW